ncbi:hypothetical protein [Chlorobium phaeobacteroides]|jgi:hypothetical protein|uniref:hypothetical protein n=1 Tax=Chlorobium phaeobacteroides TaxID=1096 RepID=UPI00030F56A1|nr:hypothetical protein [Chlorobium phaeobacteroides]
MERTITTIQEHARELNLTGLAGTVDLLLEEARKSEPSYSDFALALLETEISCRRKILNGDRKQPTCRCSMTLIITTRECRTGSAKSSSGSYGNCSGSTRTTT